MKKKNLEPVSSFETSFGLKRKGSGTVYDFVSRFDLSSGNSLRKKVDALCNWYEEIILNGNYFFNNYIDEHLNKTSAQHLMVMLASGKSPLSLEILLKHYDHVDKILEIDTYGMEEKQQVYDLSFPQYSEKIKCITADISSDAILGEINTLLQEYYHKTPYIVALESATFFLSEIELKNIIGSFTSADKQNLFLVKYFIPPEEVSNENRNITTTTYEHLKEYAPDKNPQLYTLDDLTKIFALYGGELLSNGNLHTIEKKRTGCNKYFANPQDSWIECAVWKI